MYEVEIKFLVANLGDFERQITKFGAVPGAPVTEIDLFFQHPNRDFATTDECLRIRTRESQLGIIERFMTYKGPKIDRKTKTRKEIEIPLDNGQPWQEMLESLGFRPHATVKKSRRRGEAMISGHHVAFLLDTVSGLDGNFVEIETLADAERLEEARNFIIGLAKELGLENAVRTSYLGLISKQNES